MNLLIKLQRSIRAFLKKRTNYKLRLIDNGSPSLTDQNNKKTNNPLNASGTKTSKPKGYHKPNQSSIRLKSHLNRPSIDINMENLSYMNKYNLDEKNTKFYENYRIENALYTGEMINGLRHGKGVQIWDDGAKYDGEWKFDKANGYGTFFHTDGDIYQGQWANDRANGEGTYINSDGATYQGQWRDDIQEGYGVEVWSDGSSYKGYYVDGKKEGFGIYNWNDGSKYEGEWKDNKKHGQGQLVTNKCKYSGLFKK